MEAHEKKYHYFVSFACTNPDGTTHFGRGSVILDHPVSSKEDVLEMENSVINQLQDKYRDGYVVVLLSWKRFESPE